MDLLQREKGSQNCIDALVSDCKSELRAILMVQIQHYYCEANKCADALARREPCFSKILFVFGPECQQNKMTSKITQFEQSKNSSVKLLDHVDVTCFLLFVQICGCFNVKIMVNWLNLLFLIAYEFGSLQRLCDFPTLLAIGMIERFF